MYTDSHCHLEDDEVALRAWQAGVGFILNAGKDWDESEAQIEMCQRMTEKFLKDNTAPKMWTSAGVHPDSAKEKLKTVTEEVLLKATENEYVIAIGECGLDYHYGADCKEEQKEMFRRHVEVAGKSGLPLMIHHREAEEDMLNILTEGQRKYPNLKGVIHCFSASAHFGEEVLKMGFYLSASGIVTFKSAQDIAEVFKTCPENRILIETDSPYLAPVPYRGKENEPAFVVKTAEKIAEIRGLTVEEIAFITTNNFFNLYSKAKR